MRCNLPTLPGGTDRTLMPWYKMCFYACYIVIDSLSHECVYRLASAGTTRGGSSVTVPNRRHAVGGSIPG